MNGKATLYTGVLSVGLMAWAASGGAQEDTYDSGFMRAVEGSVSVQRAESAEPEPGEVNLPVLPGDRVWTGAGAHAAIRFVDGALVRLDETTKVDFMAFGAEPNLRLWSGSVVVTVDGDSAAVRVDTPTGSVFPQTAGTYRIDVTDGMTTTVSVADGVAELAAEDGSVLVSSGQTSVLEPSSRPREPFATDVATASALDRWRQASQRQDPRPRGVALAELPAEVHHYVDDLDDYGSWRQDAVHGAVWYPTSVGAGWAPYRNGRWCYTSYGYTWVAHEPWGWAPHHYGRWGYNDYGWYWVPGRRWSPAWVSVAVGSFWVGWSPLGYHGGPVFAYGHGFYGGGRYPHANRRHPYRFGRRGRAVPRHVYDHGAGWNFSRRDHFGRRGKARLRAADVRSSASSARVHHQGAVLDRSLTPRAIGRPSVLAKRDPRVAPFRSRVATPTRSMRERSPSRVFGSSPASARGTRSAQPRTTVRQQPTRTPPTRTRVRSRSRVFGATDAPATSPRTRAQDPAAHTPRRRAVTRSDRSDGSATTRGRATSSRSRDRRPTNVTGAPPRSPQSVNGPSRARDSRRAGPDRATHSRGRGAPGVRSSHRSGRGAAGVRSRGARRGTNHGSRGAGGKKR